MSKRGAAVQITKDTYDRDDEDRYGPPIIPGTWQSADEETLKKRVIRKAKRPTPSANGSLPLPPANPTADLSMIPSKVDYMFGLPGQAVEVLLFDPREAGCDAVSCPHCHRCGFATPHPIPPASHLRVSPPPLIPFAGTTRTSCSATSATSTRA